MRGACTVLLALLAAAAGACQAIAGIEDLELTPVPADATSPDVVPAGETGADDASSEQGVADAAEGAPDAPAPAPDSSMPPQDASHDAVTVDSHAPPEAGDAAITYDQEVMMDAPLAFWRFDETTGTTALDSSGNGHDGMYVGGFLLGQPGAITGDPGKSVSFDGMTAWMTAGNVLELAGATPCSFEAWIEPVLDMGYHDVLSRSDGQGGSTNGTLMYVEPQSSGYVDFAHYSAGTANIAESNSAVATGTFTHVVGVYDGTNLYVYGNGVLLDMKPAAFATPATPGDVFIVGAQSDGITSWFSGLIDDVAVYGTALPAARILAHYKVGTGQMP
jgi:hypothetical protein